MTEFWHTFSQWYLGALDSGGYWLIAALMAMESTIIPVPSELVIPPAAYVAHTRGTLNVAGVALAGTLGSWAGASLMYWAARSLGRALVLKLGPRIGIAKKKVERAEIWAAHYGGIGIFFSRLLPLIRHLIGIPAGIVRMDFRWYSLATLLGSACWCSVLAWLGLTVGKNPELLAGSLHRFLLLVLAVAVVLAALYYFFVARVTRKNS